MFRRYRADRRSHLRAVAVPARAQLVVIDPATWCRPILIADRTQQDYEQLQAIPDHPADGAGARALDRYRIPPIGITAHDPSRAGRMARHGSRPQFRRRARHAYLATARAAAATGQPI